MKHTSRISSALFFSLLLTTPFVSSACGDTASAQKTDDTSSDSAAVSDTVTDAMQDDLPDFDFGGREFRMLSFISSNCYSIHFAEEDNGEIVNDAIHKANRTVEERFNVKITEDYDLDLSRTGMLAVILAGDDVYDINITNDLSAMPYVEQNLVYNYNKLPYVNLSKPYWDASLNQRISINGQYYYALGGFDLSHLDYTHMIAFNKNLIENYKLESPYTLVDDGKWTIDKMAEYMKAVSVNPDMMTADANDIYGYVATAKQVLPNFWMSSGEVTIAKNEKDIPYFNVVGNEKFADIVDKCFSLFWDNQLWSYYSGGENVPKTLTNLFAENRVLFADTTFHFVKTFREVESDFGLLPYPKWDGNQEAYYSRVEGGTRFPVVPITVSDTEFVSVILEALACENIKTVLPAYYEVGLKGKIARDTDSEEMLSIIYATRTYDMGDTIWCTTIRDGAFYNMFIGNRRDLASTAASLQSTMTEKLAGIDGYYRK